MKQKNIFLILAIAALFFISAGSSDAKDGQKKIPGGCKLLTTTDILGGGVITDLALKIITSVDKSLAEASKDLISKVNDDPSFCVFYMNVDGMPKYTDFFKSSAIVNGAVVFSKYSVSQTITAMKKASRSSTASQEMEKSTKELTADEIQQISSDFKAMKGKLDDDAKAELKKCLVYLAYSSASMAGIVDASQKLIATSQDIAKGVTTDFVGMNALKAPQITSGIKGSVDNLTNGVKETPALLKNITILISALTFVLGN